MVGVSLFSKPDFDELFIEEKEICIWRQDFRLGEVLLKKVVSVISSVENLKVNISDRQFCHCNQ